MNQFIFSVENSNNSIHPYPEIEQMIIGYLDPMSDYKSMIFLNKFYHKTITEIPIYTEIKTICKKNYRNRFSKRLVFLNRKSSYFILACEKGYLSLVKYLYSKHKEKLFVSFIFQHGLLKSCRNGHLEIVKYLLSIDKNLHALHMKEFRRTALRGHLHVIQFLYSFHKINPSVNSETNKFVFNSASNKGHLHIIKWLYTEGYVIDMSRLQFYFEHACLIGNLEMAQWFYYLNENVKPDIYCKGYTGGMKISDHLFIKASRQGHTELFKWLVSLSDRYELVMNGDNIDGYYVKQYHTFGACDPFVMI